MHKTPVVKMLAIYMHCQEKHLGNLHSLRVFLKKILALGME